MRNRPNPPSDHQSGPVVFVPGEISRITAQAKNHERVSIFIAGEFSFGVARIVAARHGLQTGLVVDQTLFQTVMESEQEHQALEAAIRLLTTRPRSIAEIRQQLRKRNHTPEAIDAAIVELEHRNYVNDAEFATFWVENRESNKPRGRLLLEQELRQKGVARAHIENALANADIDELESASKLVEQRQHRYRDLETEVKRRRLLSFLQRRGYTYDIARKAIEASDAQSELPFAEE